MDEIGILSCLIWMWDSESPPSEPEYFFSFSRPQSLEPAPHAVVGIADRHVKNGRNIQCFLRDSPAQFPAGDWEPDEPDELMVLKMRARP